MAGKGNSTKRRKRREEARRIEEIPSGLDVNVKSIIRALVFLVIIIFIFYLLSLRVINKKNTKTNPNVEFNYSDIMLGESFNRNEKEYLVLFYDRNNGEVYSALSDNLSKYNSKKDALTIYTVDMSNGINSKYSSEESNTNPTSASELKINGPTLIKFSNNKAKEYIEGTDNINNFLGK